MEPRRSAVLVVLVAACGSPTAPAPLPARVEPAAATDATPTVAPRVAEQQPAPAPARENDVASTSLVELLPSAPSPITLQHARTIAKDGTWAESAAIYDALVAKDPKDIRALAGRGFALASWGDPRVVDHARADFEAALAMSPAPKLASAIHFNAGNLEEAVGDRARAASHYRESIALRRSADASRALERVGGDAKRIFGDGVKCELTGPLAATRAGSFPDVLTKIRAAQELPPKPAPHDADAQAVLCDGECPSVGFVATLGIPDGSTELFGTTEAHVVVRGLKAMWVIPRIAMGNGNAARCPDEITDIAIDEIAGLVRARFTLLSNYWEDCDIDDDDCMSGCFWMSRDDHVVWVVPATGDHVVFRASLAIAEPTADAPWERLEEQRVLPKDVTRVDDAGVHVRGCSITRDVALRASP